MKLAAIICEYNPLHNGHFEHIRFTREQTACDAVICVMSGNFVQRGEAAILDKYTRARAALICGADMVIELPSVFAVAGADIFADGAIRMISGIKGMQWLSFGSESGNLDELSAAANNLKDESKLFSDKIKANLNLGMSYPRAHSQAGESIFGNGYEKLVSSPNNILAIEYLKALSRNNCDIIPVTFKRIGCGYNKTQITGTFDSASAIRKAVAEGSWEDVSASIPISCQDDFKANYADFNKMQRALSDIVMFNIISKTPEELKNFYDYAEGIEHRILHQAQSCPDIDMLALSIKTKRYTLARLKRMLLYPTLKITKELMKNAKKCQPYLNVLGVKKDSKFLLSALPIYALTRKSDAEKIDDENTKNMLGVNILADDLYCQISSRHKGMFYSGGIVIV